MCGETRRCHLLCTALLAVLAGCRGSKEAGPGERGARPAAAHARPSADTAAPSSSIQKTPAEEAAAFLRTARVIRLTSTFDPASGSFEALLQQSESRTARAWPALVDAPNAHKRPLAFYRLARALGIETVPVTIKRAFHLGELPELSEPGAAGPGPFGDRLAILNDGTVDVLLATPGIPADPWRSPEGTEIAVAGGAGGAGTEAHQKWAMSPVPLPGEQTPLLRSYIEMLALDFLAANVLRKSALLSSREGLLLLMDNRAAFPDGVDPRALDPLLSSLAACARFPRRLHARLQELTPSAVRALLLPGPFEQWLISPRNAVLLDERRASLLSLIEAKIQQAGEAAVLSL